MLAQLLVAGLLLAVCVVIHASGTHAVLRHLHHRISALKGARFPHPVALLILLFLFVFALHAVEMLIWAMTYMLVGTLPSLQDAVYFSVSSYTTVGYGDVVLGPAWRILGASEAASRSGGAR